MIEMKKLIDSHAHLSAIDPIGPALEKAISVGVTGIVAVGMDLPSNEKTLDLAKKFPGFIFPALGYHPWSVKEHEIDTTLCFIEKHIEKCVAIGEVGLDYKIKTKKAIQQEVFSRVLNIAEKHHKPVIVHTRFSHERAHRMAVDSGLENVVFHWYSGPEDVLGRIIEDGYFISATPALAYSRAHRAAVFKTPLDKILIETDSPVKYRYQTSEPATLLETLRYLADLKEIPEDETAHITADNTRKFFNLAKS